jgi:hypothetical protein
VAGHRPAVSLPVLAWETLGQGSAGRFIGDALCSPSDARDADATRPLPPDVPTFPFAPTLEGQYIIKNVVLVGAAMVVGATVRGGRLVPDGRAADVAEGLAEGNVGRGDAGA